MYIRVYGTQYAQVTESTEMYNVNIKLYEAVGSAYEQQYRKQNGGTTVFRGSRRWQRGDGVGEILRGIARFMLPVVLRGASAFAGETLDANERGESLGNAAKGALKPALQAAVQAVAENFQGGVGKQEPARSKRSIKRKRKSSKRKSESGSADQKGKGRRKAAAKRVYKGKRASGGNQLGGNTSAAKVGKVARKKGKSLKSTPFSNANTNF